MTQYLDAIVQYGFPAVAAAIMLALYVTDRRRANSREDMLLQKVLHGHEGDGNGNPGVPGMRQVVREALREDGPAALNGYFRGVVRDEVEPLTSTLRDMREAVAWQSERITQLPCVEAGECPNDSRQA